MPLGMAPTSRLFPQRVPHVVPPHREHIASAHRVLLGSFAAQVIVSGHLHVGMPQQLLQGDEIDVVVQHVAATWRPTSCRTRSALLAYGLLVHDCSTEIHHMLNALARFLHLRSFACCAQSTPHVGVLRADGDRVADEPVSASIARCPVCLVRTVNTTGTTRSGRGTRRPACTHYGTPACCSTPARALATGQTSYTSYQANERLFSVCLTGNGGATRQDASRRILSVPRRRCFTVDTHHGYQRGSDVGRMEVQCHD